MDRRSRSYLIKAGQPGGFTDRTAADWSTAHGLEKKGLVTVIERLVAVKGMGVFPAPHVAATETGRIVLAALTI